jgi:hypothetical protein
VLNRDNMVGLLYIHDPKCSPEQHADEARQLREAFDSQYSMAVFQLKDQGGVQGDLLTTGTGSSGGSNAGGGGSSGGGASAAGSNAAGGSNAGVQGMGQDPAEGEEDGDDVARDTDQQQARKKRRTAEGTGGGADQEGGPRLLTFEEYLQQRAGKKKIAVSAV